MFVVFKPNWVEQILFSLILQQKFNSVLLIRSISLSEYFNNIYNRFFVEIRSITIMDAMPSYLEV